MDWYALINECALVVCLMAAVVVVYRKCDFRGKLETLWVRFEADRIHWLCVAGLGLLFLITRLFKLDQIPLGYHVDEAAMSYNAFCLAHYGVDRYLDVYPFVVNNFGGGQSALYSYILLILLKVFDYSLFVTRIPAVVFGGITACFSYLLTRKILGKRSALFVLFLIVISPYFLMASRWGLDCNLYLGAFVAAIYIFVCAIEKGSTRWYVLAGCAFGVVLYTYSLAYLALPVFLFVSTVYLMWMKKIRVRDFIGLAIPLFILALPLMLFVVINAGYLSEISTAYFTIPQFSFYRASEISPSHLLENLNIFRILLMEDGLTYNALPEFGTLYYMSIPLVFVGMFLSGRQIVAELKHKKYSIEFFVFLMFLSILLCSMMVYEPNINRTNAIYFPLVYFVVVAVREIFRHASKLGWIVVALYAVCAGFFFDYYFNDYSKDIYPQKYFNDGIYENMPYINELAPEHSVAVYIDPTNVQMPHIYTVIYELMSPYDFIPKSDPSKNYSYWNYRFYLPDEIDRNGIYMIYKDYSGDYQRRLEADGFHVVEQNGYKIFTR